MTRTAFYFGPEDRPLFGWLHTPDAGVARGGVVLCPSLGIEALAAHQTFRWLANRLCAAGIAALRFDYDGTGDSAGSMSDGRRVEAWAGSVREAVAALRDAGTPTVVVAGMRVGATIASGAIASGCTVDGLVLWDPVLTGGTFLREQRALRMLSVAVPTIADGSTEGPGVVFGPELAEELGALRLVAAPSSGPVLVLERPERRDAAKLRAAVADPSVDWQVAIGQAELLDVLPDMAKVPERAVDLVVAWCETLIAGAGAGPPGSIRLPARREAVVGRTADGRRLVERPVELGGNGIFAVTTQAEGSSPGPTVLLSNAGVLAHVGPGDVWVQLGRRLAARGIRVARMDQSGIGDSPPRPGRAEHVVYGPVALDDFREAAEALEPFDPASVVIAGLCSGAYHAIEVGRVLGSRAVCAVNPILTFLPDEAGDAGSLDPRRAAAQPLRGPLRALARREKLVAAAERLPRWLWWLLDRLSVQPSPGRGLERLAERGVRLLLVCGEDDAKPFLRRANHTLKQLERSGMLRFELVAGLDHTMFARQGREATLGILEKHLLEHFSVGAAAMAPAGAPSAGPPDLDPMSLDDRAASVALPHGIRHEP